MSEKNVILVVEDNDFVRMQIVSYLKEMKYAVLEATAGDKALDHMFANDNIGLAIVDVRMEPVGGFEFIKALRNRNINTPVILVTGDQNSDLLEQANRLAVAAVLMKPVQKERLMKIVDRTIQGKRRD
mgnify:CR=1 FL=1